jgi:hypothetical protein
MYLIEAITAWHNTENRSIVFLKFTVTILGLGRSAMPPQREGPARR